MARAEYKNLSVKMDKTIHKGFEQWLKATNKERNKNKVYKVRVIEDLIFLALVDIGWFGSSDSNFITKYRKEMSKRPSYTIFKPNFKNKNLKEH